LISAFDVRNGGTRCLNLQRQRKANPYRSGSNTASRVRAHLLSHVTQSSPWRVQRQHCGCQTPCSVLHALKPAQSTPPPCQVSVFQSPWGRFYREWATMPLNFSWPLAGADFSCAEMQGCSSECRKICELSTLQPRQDQRGLALPWKITCTAPPGVAKYCTCSCWLWLWNNCLGLDNIRPHLSRLASPHNGPHFPVLETPLVSCACSRPHCLSSAAYCNYRLT